MIPSFAQWNIERMPGVDIPLYRKMSEKEYRLWKEGKFEQLGSEWGYGKKIVHFSTNKNETSSPLGDESPLLEIQIPKKILLELAKQNKIWSGILDRESMTTEIVLPADHLEMLHVGGNLKILP